MQAGGPERGGNRLDAFVDAAFAFALTLLILTADASLPRSMAEFTEALKRIPAFAAGFALIAMFWYAHVMWARLFGVRNAASTFLSVTLVFAVLVFVYPLRTMASSLMYFVSGGALPSEFVIDNLGDFRVFVVTYSTSYFVMSALVAALYIVSLRHGEAFDRAEARAHRNVWLIQSGTALTSLILALASERTAPLAMWVYALLGIVLPAYGIWVRQAERSAARRSATRVSAA